MFFIKKRRWIFDGRFWRWKWDYGTAGKCADKLNIKNLLLYHTEDTDLEKRKKLYTDEAKSVFGGNVFVPYDLEKVIIK